MGATRGMKKLLSATADDDGARLVVRAQNAFAPAARALAERPEISQDRAADLAEVAVGVHPVGSANHGSHLLQPGHVEPVQLAAVDDDARVAVGRIPPKRSTEPEAGDDEADRWAAAEAPRADLAVVPIVAVLNLHAILLLQRGDLSIGETNAVDDHVARLRVSHAGHEHDGEKPAREDLHQMTPRLARSAICSVVYPIEVKIS